VIFWQINDSGAKMPDAPATRPGFLACIATQRRGTVMVEFAIVGPIFFALLFLALDFAYGAFLQGVLDTAVQAAARQIQVGTTSNAGGPTTGAQLQSQYVCPDSLGLLNCGNLFIRVESIDLTSTSLCPGGYNAQDLYNATDGSLPGSGYTLGLSLYSNGTGYGAGAGGTTTCEASGELSSASSPGYCVAGGSGAAAPVMVILSAVYMTPTFLGKLLPGTYNYNGNTVRAFFSSAALITEGFNETGTATC
jgi:hypothetical protein